MDAFLKAINALFKTGDGVPGSLYTAVEGRMFLNEAPANSTLPTKYLVVTLDRGDRIRSMGQAANEAGRRVPFIISAYVNETHGSLTAAQIGDLIEALYDMAQLTSACFPSNTWKCRGCVEIGNPVLRHEHPYDVWAAKFQAWLDKA